MEDLRSKSCREGRMQIERYKEHKGVPTNMQDLRSYSVSYASNEAKKEMKMKKVIKSNNIGSTSSKSWSFKDPELQRKSRVVGYKVYAVEGKMKGSFRKSFRWIKNTYTHVLYGWR